MLSDEYFYDAVDLLKSLIAIPSFSREEEAAADFLENYINSLGLKTLRKGNNIWIKSSNWDENKPTVLLNSHIDTVRPASGWTRDPFSPTEEDGRLYGLGSNDAGASLVSLLSVFRLLDAQPQATNYIFLVSAEEEVSGANGIASVLPSLGTIDYAVVGEPTEMQPAIAEKGLMVIDATVEGKAGHAARDEGENSIYKAIPAIEWFRSKRFERISPLSGAVKMTVTMIEAGSQHNVVPAECRFTVDVRTNECYTNRELFETINRECGCKVEARSFRLNSSSIPADHPLVRRAVMLGGRPFASPTLSDQSLMPFPSLKIGPGDSARSHTADEFVCLDEIREGIEFYWKLLK